MKSPGWHVKYLFKLFIKIVILQTKNCLLVQACWQAMDKGFEYEIQVENERLGDRWYNHGVDFHLETGGFFFSLLGSSGSGNKENQKVKCESPEFSHMEGPWSSVLQKWPQDFEKGMLTIYCLYCLCFWNVNLLLFLKYYFMPIKSS